MHEMNYPTAAPPRSDLAPRVDRSAIRTGQAVTAVLLSASFILSWAPLAVAVGAANLIAASWPRLSFFRWIHRNVVRRLGLQPDIAEESPAPHRFAQRFSGTVTVIGGVTVALGTAVVGWALVLLVVALAAINVTVRWCAGCATYRVIHREVG